MFCVVMKLTNNYKSRFINWSSWTIVYSCIIIHCSLRKLESVHQCDVCWMNIAFEMIFLMYISFFLSSFFIITIFATSVPSAVGFFDKKLIPPPRISTGTCWAGNFLAGNFWHVAPVVHVQRFQELSPWRRWDLNDFRTFFRRERGQLN